MKFSCGIILGDSIRKRGGKIHIENFPSFFLKFCREIITGMIPWDSPYIYVKIWGVWMAWPLGIESWRKKQSNFGVVGPSTEKPKLIGLNAVDDNRMHFGFDKK